MPCAYLRRDNFLCWRRTETFLRGIFSELKLEVAVHHMKCLVQKTTCSKAQRNKPAGHTATGKVKDQGEHLRLARDKCMNEAAVKVRRALYIRKNFKKFGHCY